MNKRVNVLRDEAKNLPRRYIEGSRKLDFPDETPKELLNMEEERRRRNEEKRRLEMKNKIQRRLFLLKQTSYQS